MNEPNQPPSAEPKAFPISVLVYWLNEQLLSAKKSLCAREQMDAIYKEVYEPSEEEINREVAGIDIGKMADAVRDRIAQSRKRLREDELRLNASECPFCKGQSEAIRSKCTHNPFDLI